MNFSAYDDAIAAARKATELNPKAGAAYNTLGMGLMIKRQLEPAVEAFKKFVELAPTEYQGQDSLGEALLMSNQLDEAAAAFKKATELSAQAYNAWAGLGQVRALRGDFKGANEALAKAKEVATLPDQKTDMMDRVALTQFAEGKTADAIKTLEQQDKESKALKSVYGGLNSLLDRSWIYLETGKTKEALAALADALSRVDKDPVSPWGALNTRSLGLSFRAALEARAGKKDDAQKTLSLVEEVAKKAPENAWYQSNVHWARGQTLLAANDAKAAAAELGQCIVDDVVCHYHQVLALTKAGDKAGADALTKKLLDLPLRPAYYLYVRAKLGGAPKAPAKEAPKKK